MSLVGVPRVDDQVEIMTQRFLIQRIDLTEGLGGVNGAGAAPEYHPIAPEGPPLPVFAGKGADTQGLIPCTDNVTCVSPIPASEARAVTSPVQSSGRIKYQPPDRQ